MEAAREAWGDDSDGLGPVQFRKVAVLPRARWNPGDKQLLKGLRGIVSPRWLTSETVELRRTGVTLA